MTPEQHRLAGSLFDEIRELPEEQWPRAVEERCAPDTELAAYLLRLLQADQRLSDNGFLAGGALQDAARLVPDHSLQGPAIGTVIGSFRIEQRLGAGGMGIVYEAVDLRLKRRVALKLLPTYADGEQELRILRFQREARAASQLNHPNIVSILDAGCDKGFHYIAMEFVEGKTLRKLLAESKTHRFEDSEVVEILGQVASALSAAHEGGIIHRDVKPENIMLRPDGFVKVLDFGLAAMTTRDRQSTTNLLTQPGHLAGTMSYVSPEQLMGKPASPQSDLWGLGVVGYELATGKGPFRGATDAAVINSILNAEPPSPRDVCPSVSGDLEGLILRLLEKDPQLRFQTASDLRSSCRRMGRDFGLPQTGHGGGSPRLAAATDSPAQSNAPNSSSKPGARGGKYWMGATAAASLIGVVLYLSRPLPEPQVTRDFQVTTVGRVTRFVNDGTWLYYSAGSAGANNAFYVISAQGGSARELPKFRGMVPLDISSDHSEILLGETNKGQPYPLWIGPIFGSEPHRLSELRAADAHWSSRRDKIVYTTGKDLRVANSDGSGGHILLDRTDANWRIAEPSFFDDDRRIRFHAAVNNVEKIWDINTDGSGLHPVLPDWNDTVLQADPAFARDGRYSLFTSGTDGIVWDLWMLPESSGMLSFRRPRPVRLTSGPLCAAHPQFSYDGRRIFYLGDSDQTELIRYDTQSNEWTPYLGGMSAFQLDFSADGEWITYVAPPGHSVWCSRKDGTQATLVSPSPLNATTPRFSPDRSKIVFFGYQPGRRTGMFLVSPSGGPVTVLVPNGREVETMEPDWSPDGREVVYAAERSLWVMDLATRDARKLPNSEGLRSPRWSPDGKYVVAADKQLHLWLYGMTDQSRVLLTTLGSGFPHWSRDSKYVYFEDAGFSTWYRISIEQRRVEEIASLARLHLPFASMGWVGMTPEGAVIVSRGVGTRNIYAIEWEIR